MTVSDIFKDLSGHMLKGVMFHGQMADYYGFLNLYGYKSCHEYHAMKEYKAYRDMHTFYMGKYGQLLEEEKIENPSVIPQTWLGYNKKEVDRSTKRQSVKNAAERWVHWESEAKAMLCTMVQDLREIGDEIASGYVLQLAKDTADELEWAQKKHIDLSAADYDIIYILDQQDHLHKWYKKKMKEMTD